MPDAFDKLAFETAQMARIGWFFGQKTARRATSETGACPGQMRGPQDARHGSG